MERYRFLYKKKFSEKSYKIILHLLLLLFFPPKIFFYRQKKFLKIFSFLIKNILIHYNIFCKFKKRIKFNFCQFALQEFLKISLMIYNKEKCILTNLTMQTP